MNPDVPEPQTPPTAPSEREDASQSDESSSPGTPAGSVDKRRVSGEIAPPPFSSRSEARRVRVRRRSFFPSAVGMEKARKMAADILKEAPSSITAVKNQAHSVPWWKWITAGVVVVVAVVSLPLGGWRTTVSAADTVQSSPMGQAQAVGPFSITVGKAGWFNGLGGLGSFDPEKDYLVMRVTINKIAVKGPLPTSVINDVLSIHLPGQAETPPADGMASGLVSEALNDLLVTPTTHAGLRFAGTVRSTDEKQTIVIQPGFDQEFFVFWERPEGAQMAPNVTVRVHSLKERRSTLDDSKIWTDPHPITYVELPVAPVQGVQ